MLLRLFGGQALLVAILGSVTSIACGQQGASAKKNELLAVQTTVTWRTVSGPEVNFLLQNRGNENVVFAFHLSEMLKMKDTCTPRLGILDRSIIDAVELRERREMTLASGVIPAHQWVYRTYSIFGGMSEVPCEMGFRIFGLLEDSQVELFNSVIRFPSKMALYGITSSDRHGLSVQSMVERDFRDGQVLVNILIENNGVNDEQIWVSDRSLSCAGQTRATWNTEWPVSEGEDNGPRNVGRGSWAVLVTPVRLSAGKSFDKCTATFFVSRRVQLADKSDFEWRLVRKIDVPLKPVGRFGM